MEKSKLSAKSGDLIFFDWDGNDLPDHVGIVEKVENIMNI